LDAAVDEALRAGELVFEPEVEVLVGLLGGKEFILRIALEGSTDDGPVDDPPDLRRFPLPAFEGLAVEKRNGTRQGGEREKQGNGKREKEQGDFHGVSEEFAFAESGHDGVAAGFDRFLAAFLAIDQADHERDPAALAFHGFDRLQGGAAGGDDVVRDGNDMAWLKRTFDLTPESVGFRFFADAKGVDRFRVARQTGTNGDGQRDGICPMVSPPTPSSRMPSSASLARSSGWRTSPMSVAPRACKAVWRQST